MNVNKIATLLRHYAALGGVGKDIADTEIAAANEIERLQEWCDILANDHCECEPDMAADGNVCPYCLYRGTR